MRVRFTTTLASVLLLTALVRSAAAQPASGAPPKIDPLAFTKDIEAFEAADKTSPPPEGAVLFTGSSSIRLWHPRLTKDMAPLTVVPRGFGGTTMEDLLYWIDRVAIAYKPRAIVVYEGDNDTGRNKVPPAKIAGQFESIVKKIHTALPKTRIYVISVKPSVSRWATWPAAVETNQLLEAIAKKDPLITYIDMAKPLLLPDGQVMTDIFVADNLHLNPKGYDLWSAAVRAVIVPAEEKYEAKKH